MGLVVDSTLKKKKINMDFSSGFWCFLGTLL